MANSEFLPALNAILNDQGLKIGPPPAGPKVTLLGVTSNSGIPLREPTTVSSVEKAINSLWFSGASSTEPYPGELSRAIEEASTAGANAIEVIVINNPIGARLDDYVHPTGIHTGRFMDLSGAYDVLKNRDLDVVVPVGAYIDDNTLSSDQNFGKQLADFCFQTTKEQNAAYGVISVTPPAYWAIQHELAITGNLTLIATEVSGLADGTTIESTKNALFSDVSSDLVNEWFKYHTATTTLPFTEYPTIYANFLSGSYDTSHRRFANAANSSAVNAAYLTSWQAQNTDLTSAVDGRNVKVDAGSYINVLAAPLKATSTQVKDLAAEYGAPVSSTSYVTDGVAPYAGLTNALAPHSATTNKFISGVFPHKLLSRTQANTLTGMRFVTMYTRSKGFVVAKDTTGAYNVNKYVRSDYVLLTTMRIAQTAVDLIRAVAEDFIGEPNNAPQMNALNNEIDQVLLSMKGSALNAYDFVITSTPEQRVLGELDIALTLVPAFEVTTIELTVSLAKSL
jgi:hypothetical protein